ncbi:MAG: RNA methyltransferase [Bryobacteraceae bacterium]
MEPLSEQNPLFKKIRRASSHGGLTDDGCAIAEGLHLVEEAIAAGCEVKAILLTQPDGRFPGAKLVSEKSFRSIAGTETPQGVLALVKPHESSMEAILRGQALAVVLDGIQDPGNAGSILRAAEAFGATGAVFLKGSVNPYNPKCIRASAGSIFRLPVVVQEDLSALAGIALYAAMPRTEKSIDQADFAKPCAVVIGSEGRGVRASIAARADGLRIPTSNVESLNAAVAAGVLFYEARRQRDAAQKQGSSGTRAAQ